MVISGAIRYKVIDIRKAMLEVRDSEESLIALFLGVLLSAASTMTESELFDTERLGESILKKIREEASGWGLKIQKVYITDLGRTKNIRLLTNDAVRIG
jgi:regulator of protease activity HflC (stomatin/prohibitin superfamily)